jgi:hypothetical protein
MFMLIGAPAVTHGARRGVMCRPESPDFDEARHDTPLEHSMCQQAPQHRAEQRLRSIFHAPRRRPASQCLVSPDHLSPPNTYRSLPTATMPCLNLALGGEPETREASSCSHCIVVVESRTSSFDTTARSNMHTRLSASRHMTILSSAGPPCAPSESPYVYAHRRPRCDSRCQERGDVPSRVTRL